MNIKIKKACLAASAVGLISIAEANTVAYWPMNLTTNGSQRLVLDASPTGANLTLCGEATYKCWSFSTADIGWTLPPNQDAAGGGVESLQFLSTCNGVTNSNGKYVAALSSSSASLCEALACDRDFTIEGWIRLAALPASGDGFVILGNTLTSLGGWIWRLKSGESGFYDVQADINSTGNSSNRTGKNLGAKLSSDELLGKWNHFAIVHLAKTGSRASSWRFYLNGCLRGSVDDGLSIADVTLASPSCYISGAGSKTAQHVIGDMTSFRVSDEALGAEDLLCAVSREKTVAYWPMSAVSIGTARKVLDSTGSGLDLTCRAASYGGLEFIPNDIGWTTPPNADPLAYNAGPWTSDVMVRITKGEPMTGGKYLAAFTYESADLAAVLTPTNDFCVEGWFKAAELPASSSANQMFIYNTLGTHGGWAFNLYGADADGKCNFKVRMTRNSSTDYLELGAIPSAEILNKWCHYAIVYENTFSHWKFYFNGALVGCAESSRINDVSFASPSVCLFGCRSTTMQIPHGDATTWRVSRDASPSRLLCGVDISGSTLTWTGSDGSTWSTGSQTNWKDANAADVSWRESARAVFDGTGTDDVTLESVVNPTEIVIDSDTDLTISSASTANFIGPCCEKIVKRGSGTLCFKSVSSGLLNKSSNRIIVEEGTLRASGSANKRYLLGNGQSAAGYGVTVLSGATLWIDARNTFGEKPITTANRSFLTICTNGVLDLTCPDSFNLQTVGTLSLLGGTLTPPDYGHESGYLIVRDRAVFGKNPSKTPYFFSRDLRDGSAYDTMTWQFGTNTVFEVADITEDANPDVTFDNHLMAIYDWDTNTHACCFHKTGAGTMVLAQSADRIATTSVCYPSGTSTIEEGELCLDCLYSSSFAVSSGAFLSGTGTVSNVTFADGAGLRGVMNKRGGLKVTGDCALGASGTVELRRAADGKLHSVTLLTVDGAFTGTESLANWTLTVDGEPTQDIRLCVVGNKLKAQANIGCVLIVR